MRNDLVEIVLPEDIQVKQTAVLQNSNFRAFPETSNFVFLISLIIFYYAELYLILLLVYLKNNNIYPLQPFREFQQMR